MKKYKDLYGIWFVLTQLEATSSAAQKALSTLMAKSHESWAKTFRENLKSWIENSTPRDWDLLNKQDANGKLSPTNFQKILSEI